MTKTSLGELLDTGPNLAQSTLDIAASNPQFALEANTMSMPDFQRLSRRFVEQHCRVTLRGRKVAGQESYWACGPGKRIAD